MGCKNVFQELLFIFGIVDGPKRDLLNKAVLQCASSSAINERWLINNTEHMLHHTADKQDKLKALTPLSQSLAANAAKQAASNPHTLATQSTPSTN